MASRTPGLEETIRRRKRQAIPRAPPTPLRQKVPELKRADEKLEALLEKLLYYADRETLFTMTLERERLMSALAYAGFVGSMFFNYEGQIAPSATVITYLPVPAGLVLAPKSSSYYSSLPWWLSVSIWIDADVAALPAVALLRAPDRYDYEFAGLTALRRFMLFVVTNNHVADSANYLAIQSFTVMLEETWKMVEEIYLKPVAEYAQELAEKRTGRPFP